MALPLKIKIKPKTLNVNLNPGRSLRPFSSPPDDSNGGEGNKPPSPPSFASYFGEIKERLKSPSPPPRRIPIDPSRTPSPFSSPSPKPEAESIHDIRKHLAEYRHISPNPNPNPNPNPHMSFQDLFKKTVLKRDASPDMTKPYRGFDFDAIRTSLRRSQPSPRQNTKSLQSPYTPNFLQDSLRSPSADGKNLPEEIFGRELREKKGGAQARDGDGEMKGLRTEFVKMYTHEELGEKLKKLRPAAAAKGKKDWFSLEELNARLVKLREMEEKEMNGMLGGGMMFLELRESLVRLKVTEATNKVNNSRLPLHLV